MRLTPHLLLIFTAHAVSAAHGYRVHRANTDQANSKDGAASKPPLQQPCRPETAVQRKEWSSMLDTERLAYINGIKCLMAMPSIYTDVPASTSFFSDFTVIHILVSQYIHLSGTFLSWHRHFVFLLEQALHAHCHYPPTLGTPYMDTLHYQTSLAGSALFDGSATSLGGNGQLTTNKTAVFDEHGTRLPPGTGGGCVTTGPFANTTVSLGPIAGAQAFAGGVARHGSWTVPNPRCLTRDIKDYAMARWANQSGVDAILSAPDISAVHSAMDTYGAAGGQRARRLHGAGHFGIGGEMGDFFVSPQDSAFFLHHGNLDRLWALWQEAHPGLRYVYNGTAVINNPPTAPLVVNETMLDFGLLGNVTMEEVADPTAGPYCYKYV